MTRAHEGEAHPAPHRDRVAAHEGLFAVWAAPLVWAVQLTVSFAATSNSCFDAGDRLLTHPGVEIWPLIVSIAALLIALAGLCLSIVLLRRTRDETGGSERRLVETGQGRTRFMAVWGIAFSSVFAFLIAVNIALLLAMSECAG